VGAGLFGALIPIFLADLTRGTGHYNLSQGAVATIQGGAAAISGWLAGLVVVGPSITPPSWLWPGSPGLLC
jgi:hypothetical protein